MNILKSKLLLILFLSSNITQCSNLPLNPKIELSTERVIGKVGVSIISAAAIYCIYTYLVQEDAFVAHDYPQAQAWYNSMALKYPQAHLEKKKFLQNLSLFPKSLTSWCATFNEIYFPQDALKDINYLYQKNLDGTKLTDQENLFMNMQEFLLLHEAGHVEHNDLINRAIGLIGTTIILESAALLYKEVYKINSETSIQQIIGSVTFASWLMSITLSRYQECNADKFACENGSLQALQGGKSFFENRKVDWLYDLQNYTLSPYIKTDSLVGNLTQSIANCIRVPLFSIDKGIRSLFASTDATYYLYHFILAYTHPSPAYRAQTIQDEIARRLENSAAQAV